jgi:hypothetical protein
MGLAAAALAVSVAALAYGGYTSYQTAKFNEKVAENEAEYQRKKAAVEARRQFERTQKLMGKQRVGYAKAGVSLMSGSVQDVFASTLQESAEDMTAIMVGGEAQSNKATVAAKNYSSRATGAVASTVGKVGSSVLSYGAYQQGATSA